MGNKMHGKEHSAEVRHHSLEQIFPQTGIYAFVNRLYSLNTLHVLSAVSLILLGATVVTLSVMGLISPMWLSKLMIMFSSMATMVGCYLFYSILRNSKSETLVRKAIRRVIESQN